MKSQGGVLACLAVMVLTIGCGTKPEATTKTEESKADNSALLAAAKQNQAAGNPEIALQLAHEIVAKHGASPEGVEAAAMIPALRSAAIAKQEEARQVAEREARDKAKQALAKRWSYSVSTDRMTDKTIRTAAIESENTVSFEFPYQGPQRGTLTLREHPTYGKDVIFTVDRGQILCNSFSDDCWVRVRFDDARAERWNAAGADSNSSEIIFIHNYASFLRRLRQARLVLIEVRFFQESPRTFGFEVGGFDFSQYSR